MAEYRRAYVPSGSFFFTVVTERRAPIFRDEGARSDTFSYIVPNTLRSSRPASATAVGLALRSTGAPTAGRSVNSALNARFQEDQSYTEFL